MAKFGIDVDIGANILLLAKPVHISKVLAIRKGVDSVTNKQEKVYPWTMVSAAQIQAQIDRALLQKQVIESTSGRVFLPRRSVSLRSVLLAVLRGSALRQEAEKIIDSESSVDIFRPFLNEEPRWLLHCSIKDSMVSGSWGLKYFQLRRRGYLYYEPDWGTGDDDSLPILGAWEPIENTEAFRACFLDAHTRTWERFGFPPCIGQWATGPFEIMLEAVCAVLQKDSSGWSAIVEQLQKHRGSDQAEFDQLVEETARRTELPPLVVSGILRSFLESAGTKSLIHLRKLPEREIRVIAGSFLIFIGRGGF